MEDSILIGFLVVFFVVLIVLSVLVIAGAWNIFEKAGEHGWACIIPIYGQIVMLRIIGKPWWWIFLQLIPYIGIVWQIWGLNMLSKSFGKKEDYTCGLLFLPFVFFPMLGFGKDEYQGPYGDKALYDDYQRRKNGSGFDFENDVLVS